MKSLISKVLVICLSFTLSLIKSSAAQEPISFPYCVSSPFPAFDLILRNGSEESAGSCLIDCQDITLMSLSKAMPFYKGVSPPQNGRGILGLYIFDGSVSTSIPFFNIRQASLRALPIERLLRRYDFVLSKDSLQTCLITLDPDEKKLTIEKSEGTTDEIATSYEKLDSAEVTIDGKKFKLRLDLTYPSALALSESTYRFLSTYSPKSIEVEYEHWNKTDKICRLKNLEFGGLSFPSVWCIIEGNEDIIGLGLLQRFILKLDFKSDRHQMLPSERNKEFADHSFFDGLSFGTRQDGGKQMLSIDDVLIDSIAFDSGFQKSDLLIQVGTFDLIGMNRERMAAAGHLIFTPRDAPLNCKIIRNGKEMEISLLSNSLNNAN